MNEKHNLFAAVEKNTNRAVALFESGLLPIIGTEFKELNIVPVRNTGTTTQRTSLGTISSMTVYVDSEDRDLVYYLITDWPDDMSLGEAYELTND